ncbi:beta-glucosidase [Herbidospora galbida]|uniref:Beta-glucosidase n=1 Tax=Herbidospora galbida TaxID=2575442 RepID=A0A4U3MK78_9ACTN|nr:GH1 family beta-glucosidase [Herbidospora galbida]TKK88904.1 beta-glucosidase [Herbidospora galbida]
MFLWGAATAAFQIEGALSDDGRGPSIWDSFGPIRDGHTAETACDSYRRWADDVALLADLGVNAYRFSVSWPRVQPDGTGPANPKGLDHYERLVDALLAAGITPALTLFHWDLPAALPGWLDRDTAHRFADYAALVADRLADRVGLWITLNEPFVHTVYGHALGLHAPGQALFLDALPAAHHQLLGHGLAVDALRAAGASSVLITNNLSPVWPASDSPDDRAAADAYDTLHNRMFNDPVFLGEYPDLRAFGLDAMPGLRDGDLAIINRPIDGLGVNYYNPTRISAPQSPELPFTDAGVEGYPTTAFGWPVVPDGLRELLTGLHERYRVPLYVTENGCSYEGIDDPGRIAYLDGHIDAALRADADVRGYFVWSLLDNFEWAEGYHQRFGLVHVDFTTGERTPKASYRWYRERIARGA